MISVRKVDDLWVIFNDGRRCASSTSWETVRELAARMGDRRRKVAERDRWLHSPVR